MSGRPAVFGLIVFMKKQTLNQKFINDQNKDSHKERVLSDEEAKRVVDFVLILREIDRKQKLKNSNL